MVAAWEFFETLQEIIDEGTCLPEQVFFNVDETGLYWKRCQTEVTSVRRKS